MKNSVENARIAPKIILAILAACLVGVLCGCSSDVTVSFSTDGINMYVGESRDVLPYVIFTPLVGGGEVSLTSDGDCVSVSGTRVTAIKAGEATVTANGMAKLKITVGYRDINGISLDADGDTVQNIGDGDKPQKITFAAMLPDYADPDTEITFEVNGKRAGDGDAFEFTPDGAGLFVVTSRAGNAAASRDVYVYRKTKSSAKYDGELAQAGNFTPVLFRVQERISAHNPQSTVCWYVNGELKGGGNTFSFTPRFSGEYKITFDINGVRGVFENGDKEVAITATGDRAPNVTDIELDGGVKIKWADGEHISSVTVTSPDGARATYNRFDSRYSHRFARGEFDATGLMTACAAKPSVYTVRLTADGRGEPYEFMQYPQDAAKYIDEKVLCGNSLITDGDKAAAFVFELYACGITQAKAYVAHGYDADEATEEITAAANALGISVKSAKADGRLLSIELNAYRNAPTRHDVSQSVRVSAFLPHIMYDESGRRDKKTYVFSLDRNKTEVAVENSEQLLAAALCGVKPVPNADSVAGEIYARAKNALISIIGKDYTDEQKIHAIYDFLQWSTLGVGRGGFGGETSSDYLDGVFVSPQDERRSYGTVTDLGAAKAFALLCRIEGIECDIAGAGGAFYNRVRLGGMAYNVDVYGGETRMAVVGSTPRELCSHSGLFVTDGHMGISDGDAIDASKSYYIEKSIGGGLCYDRYFDGTESAAQIKSVVGALLDNAPRGTVTVYNLYGHEEIPVTAWGIEVVAADDNTVSTVVAAIAEYCKKAFGGKFSQSAISVYSDGIVRHITIIIPQTAETARVYESC